MSALLLLLAAAACAAAPDRPPYVVDASTASAVVCERRAGKDRCWEDAGRRLFNGERLVFAAFGDSGKGTKAQRRVAAVLKKLDPQLVLLLGDVVYPTGEDEDYDARYFAYYSTVAARRPFFPAVGNHDYGNKWLAWMGKRRFDEGYARVFRRPPYYSFDAGPVHFVSLDTNQAYGIGAAAAIGPESAQARWLDADLAASTAPWKIVFMHVPLYTSDSFREKALLRDVLAPIFERRGVRLVLGAHDHIYERWPAVGGVRYLTVGTGGAALNGERGAAPGVEKRLSRHGLLLGKADAATLSLQFVGADGQTLDSLELSK